MVSGVCYLQQTSNLHMAVTKVFIRMNASDFDVPDKRTDTKAD